MRRRRAAEAPSCSAGSFWGPPPPPETQHWIRESSWLRAACDGSDPRGSELPFPDEAAGKGARGKGQSKTTDFYDMQKYSKTMQIKQFSLAGIPLRTVIKSSRSGIAISNHNWDPRQAESELGSGPGLGRCGGRACSSLKSMVISRNRGTECMVTVTTKIRKEVKERLSGRKYF